MSEWWGAIGQPFAEAVLTLDQHKIRDALVNFPHTYYEYIRGIYERSPEHVIIETFLIVFVVYITFIKKDKPTKAGPRFTQKEVDELVDDWEPEPIIPKTYKVELDKTQPYGVLESIPDTHMRIQGVAKPVLNLATFDFLGLGSRKELKDVAIKTLTKYGCGSCGPRGFYGTIDVHEILEKDLANMMGTPDTITFSDSESTSSSVLPAFAKRGDLVVVDEGCNDSILVGINLARCTVHYYKHNDMEDLARVLESIRTADKKAGRGSDCQRRYVVTEAVFRNHGDVIDLPKIVALCKENFFRLFLDESYSFGVLGASGRGITEHYGVPLSDVAIVCGSLATAAAGVGGFSTGAREIVDYQRLNSAGYVFSASAPPFTSACTSEAIRIMREEPQLFAQLRENAYLAHDVLEAGVKDLFTVSNDRCSPVIHVRLMPELLAGITNEAAKRDLQRQICDDVMQNLLKRSIAVCSPRYKTDQMLEPMPSVRVSVTAIHNPQELKDACTAIAQECVQVAKLALKNAPKAEANGSVVRQRKVKN